MEAVVHAFLEGQYRMSSELRFAYLCSCKFHYPELSINHLRWSVSLCWTSASLPLHDNWCESYASKRPAACTVCPQGSAKSNLASDRGGQRFLTPMRTRLEILQVLGLSKDLQPVSYVESWVTHDWKSLQSAVFFWIYPLQPQPAFFLLHWEMFPDMLLLNVA